MGCSQSKANGGNSPSEVKSVPPSPAPAPRPTEQPTPVRPPAPAIQNPVPSQPVQPVLEPPKVSSTAVATPAPSAAPATPIHNSKADHVAAPEPVSHSIAPVHHEPTPEPPPPVRTQKPAPPAEEASPAPTQHVNHVHAPVVHHEQVEQVKEPPVFISEPVLHANASGAHTNTITISPNVGFVIKTKDLTTGEKIFINILYHEKVTEMIALDARESTDKKGEHCLAYSVVLASSLFQLSHKYDSPEINHVSLL